MHTALRTLALAIVSASLATPAAAQAKPAPEHHMMAPSVGFDQLKPLVGEWEGQTAGGKTMHASYQLVSGGTALLERLSMAGEAEMVTLYSPDGDRLAVTHYCSAGNQPHMRTEPVSKGAKRFSFTFVSATNLATPTAGHMHHLTVNMQDPTHFAEEWTWMEGTQTHTEVFNFTRKS